MCIRINSVRDVYFNLEQQIKPITAVVFSSHAGLNSWSRMLNCDHLLTRSAYKSVDDKKVKDRYVLYQLVREY